MSDWGESDSNSDENTAPRQYKERVDYTTTLNSVEFQMRFRLDKASVEHLLVEMPHLRVKGTRNHNVSPLHQLLFALRFYALGTMLLSVGDFIGVSKASACRIVRDVSSAIALLYTKVQGAIDCTHVRIQSPCAEIGEEFRNRKGYPSINVQAVCDSELMLMNVVARWPGSAHDVTIFDMSELKVQLETGMYGNKWLLGDSAYPLKPYLLTPLLNPESPGEQLYNEPLIRSRNCIERSFGVWKRRFPVVALRMRLRLQNAHAVIIATAVLHNICRLQNLEEVPPEVELPRIDRVPVPINNEGGIQLHREMLIANYFNNL
ncbi:unnamed protein product [Euphydryas editha]|uniref:DDE Tnp4 domain-containing protein n=1 Tax=Euphydryas editha TaxID=104508 RepID=A0AAU9US94_EUPED|nr:unnamed protein product [Euphydryas editha]